MTNLNHRNLNQATGKSTMPNWQRISIRIHVQFIRILRVTFYFARGSGYKVLWWVRLCMCVSVCLFVCLPVCLYARISPKPYMRSLPNFLCMLPMAVARSSSSVVSIRFVGYFRFCGRHVFFYNGPYSGMNFATKDRFCLNLLIYRNVWHNSISYY